MFTFLLLLPASWFKVYSQHPVFEKPQPPSSLSVEEPDVMLFSVNGREIQALRHESDGAR